MYKIHIVPGWAEGNWQFKQFVRETTELKLTHKPEAADILMAHSSGVYSLPEINSSQLIVLIDPPYWPGRSIVKCVFRNVILDAPLQMREYGLKTWLQMRFWNLVYISFEPWRHVKLWRSVRKTFELSQQGSGVIFIRDTKDAYCGPGVESYLKKFRRIKFAEVSGLHESCWAQPDQYIKVILAALSE